MQQGNPLNVPELVELVVEHLHQSRYLYPALFINKLWYKCAGPLLWRSIAFSLAHHDFEDVQRFVKVFRNELPYHSSNIISLQIPFINRLSGNAIKSVLKSCKDLKQLSFVGCEDLTDAVVEYIIKKCPNLEYIELVNFGHVFGPNVPRRKELFNLSWPQLKHIDLSCRDISDATICTIAHSCPKLECLILNGCWDITDVTLSKIAKACHQLRHIDVQSCGNILDTSIENVALSCPDLHCIKLYGDNITDRSIDQIAKFSHKLQYLMLVDCPNVSVISLREVLLKCANLKLILLLGMYNRNGMMIDILSYTSNKLSINPNYYPQHLDDMSNCHHNC